MIHYSERLYPAWCGIAAFSWLAVSCGAIVAGAVGGVGGVAAFAAIVAFFAFLAWYLGNYRVVVDDEFLRAGRNGRSALPLRSITSIDPLDSGDMAMHVRGGAGGRVYCPVWISRGVRVEHDEAVPDESVLGALRFSPVWVIGTRRPDELTAALRAAVERAASSRDP